MHRVSLRGSTTSSRVDPATDRLTRGLLSLVVVVTRFRWRRWGAPVRTAWAISLVVTGGLSALVWGPPMPIIAVAFAAVASLVAWAIIGALGTALAAPSFQRVAEPLTRTPTSVTMFGHE